MRSSQPPPLKKYRDLTGAETNRTVKSIKKIAVSATSTMRISCFTWHQQTRRRRTSQQVYEHDGAHQVLEYVASARCRHW
jgi:hypothetical protein